MIQTEGFHRLDLRVGTVLTVKMNRKSRNPAYTMTIDFGGELGVKKTSSQLTALYRKEDLIGKTIVCCVNVPPLYIGLVKSEVRVLAVESAAGTVLIRPERPVENGSSVQ